MALLRGRSKMKDPLVRTPRRARTEDLVIEELEDEILVYDAKNQQAHCLTSAAAKVWRACDGTKDVPALAESLALSVDDVTRALEMLDGVELLEDQGLQIVTNGDGNGNGMTRRDFGLRSAMVGAAAAAAPMLYSIKVPSAAAAATPTNRQCALFSTDACGTDKGAGAVAGCCCCCQKTNCKVGGSTSTCNQLPGCPDPTEAPKCSASCNNNCGTTEAGNPAGCCAVAGSTGCGCAFTAPLSGGTVCGSNQPPPGCASNCTGPTGAHPPGTAGCGGGCCDATTGGPCTLGTANCVPCCNGVPLDVNTAAFGCCTPGATSTC